MKKEKIAVLMGGISSEREVSLVSGRACADALRRLGYQVIEIDADHSLMEILKKHSPDCIFNALHGYWGEDGIVQGILETYGKPYTHSGVLASALAMDKPRAKIMFESAGIPCAYGLVFSRKEAMSQNIIKPPYIIKPVKDGSSVGVVFIESDQMECPNLLRDEVWSYGESVLVETYIKGKELTVTILDGKALAVTEIKSGLTSLYDYHAKYSVGGSEHILPAEIPDEIYQKALHYSETAYTVIGCSGIARADFRYNPETETIYILEINTQPGMTPTSLVPEQAVLHNITFDDLVSQIIKLAICTNRKQIL